MSGSPTIDAEPAFGVEHRPVRWAFMGASTIAGAYMVDAIREARGGELIGVVSGDRDRARRFASEHGIQRSFGSFAEVWSEPSIDAVYISSINALHASQTLGAAAAGKHVLCEKPLATTTRDAQAMVQACHEAGVVLGVNHNLRRAPAHLLVRRLIAQGRLGRILVARVVHGTQLAEGARRWRTNDLAAGGGAALDVTVHDADLLRFLLADEPIEVAALVGAQAGDTVEVEDTVAGVLRFRGGAIATFQDSLAIPFAQTQVGVYGEAGSVEVANAMADDPIATVTLTDKGGSRLVGTPDRRGLYHGIVEAFNAAVRGHGQPAATGDDGLRAVAIARAALEAARQGRVIRLHKGETNPSVITPPIEGADGFGVLESRRSLWLAT